MLSQYSRPAKPCGKNVALCQYREPPPCGSTPNSSQASPGTCISALSRSSRFGTAHSTRQTSIASPALSSVSVRRPRFRPTPPIARSILPRRDQSTGAEYQPCVPPICEITDQISETVAVEFTLRLSVNTVRPAQSGSLGRGSLGARGTRASTQLVSTVSRQFGRAQASPPAGKA